MYQGKRIYLLIAFIFTSLLLFSCGSGNKDNPVVVTFDGENCTYQGPSVIEEGKEIVELKNLTDTDRVFVIYVRFLEGKTWEDLLSYYGGSGVSKSFPEWVKTYNFRSVPDNPNARAYILDPGQYAIVCSQIVPAGEFWYPGVPLEVEATSSE